MEYWLEAEHLLELWKTAGLHPTSPTVGPMVVPELSTKNLPSFRWDRPNVLHFVCSHSRHIGLEVTIAFLGL
jgi:hypothetical protein